MRSITSRATRDGYLMYLIAATAPAPYGRAVHDRAVELDLAVGVWQPAVADAVVVRVGFDDGDGLDDGVEPRAGPPFLSIAMPVFERARGRWRSTSSAAGHRPARAVAARRLAGHQARQAGGAGRAEETVVGKVAGTCGCSSDARGAARDQHIPSVSLPVARADLQSRWSRGRSRVPAEVVCRFVRSGSRCPPKPSIPPRSPSTSSPPPTSSN